MTNIMKFFAFIIIFITTNFSFSQIESGKVVPNGQEVPVKPKKEKKIKKEKTSFLANENDSTYNSYLFFGSGLFFSQPINREANTLFSKPMILEKQEKGIVVPLVGINYKINLTKGLYANFGFDYSHSGEKFNWKSAASDSAYSYKSTYQLLSIPIGLNYIVGKKVKFIGGFGIAPNLTFGSKRVLQVTTNENKKSTTKIPLRNSTSDFNVAGYIQAGVQFRIVNGFYFYAIPELRYSFFNTLNKQATYSRKVWQLGVQFGFSLAF